MLHGGAVCKRSVAASSASMLQLTFSWLLQVDEARLRWRRWSSGQQRCVRRPLCFIKSTTALRRTAIAILSTQQAHHQPHVHPTSGKEAKSLAGAGQLAAVAEGSAAAEGPRRPADALNNRRQPALLISSQCGDKAGIGLAGAAPCRMRA
jgi:hypothetical protein